MKILEGHSSGAKKQSQQQHQIFQNTGSFFSYDESGSQKKVRKSFYIKGFFAYFSDPDRSLRANRKLPKVFTHLTSRGTLS